MSQDKPKDDSRRVLIGATCAVGGVAAVAAAVPFVGSFAPSDRARAAGAPVDVDISGMQPGELKTVEWRGKPVWILRRDEQMLASLQATDPQVADPSSARNPAEFTPSYALNQHRSIKPEYFIAIGICTHLGCSPTARMAVGPQANLPDDWNGGFLCPCHGSTFDVAGRVFKNKPAPDNLAVPPHMYLSDTMVRIGEDEYNKA